VRVGKLRMEGGKPYVTDNDNYIVDLYFTSPIKDANKAGKEIAEVKDPYTHTQQKKDMINVRQEESS
jgi:ribose 5-phosphate isomerase